MESRLRETGRYLTKALGDFIPVLKNVEETIGMYEADVENLTRKKMTLQNDIAEKIKNSDAIIAMDKAKIVKDLDQAAELLKIANEIFLELYKAKITRLIPPEAYSEKIMEKAKETGIKVKEKREAVIA